MPTQVNYQALQFWFNVVQFLGLLAVAVYTWWNNRAKVTAKRFLKLEQEVKERVTQGALEAIEENREIRCERHRGRTSSIEGELQKINNEIKNLPNQSDIGKVYDRVHEVGKEMDQAVGELKATRRQLDLVLEQLLRGTK